MRDSIVFESISSLKLDSGPFWISKLTAVRWLHSPSSRTTAAFHSVSRRFDGDLLSLATLTVKDRMDYAQFASLLRTPLL